VAIFADEKLLGLLLQYNPWWKNGVCPSDLTPPTRRFAFYEAEKILSHPDLRRFVVLSGARRVGKTTILYQLIETLLNKGIPARRICYLSFDNPILKLGGFEAVLRVYDNAYPSDEEAFFFFDEVQYAEDWERWVKVLYDTRPQLRLVATGSASPALEQGASESGVGRWTVLRVPTLSFYEYCELLQVPHRPQLPKGLRPTQFHRLAPSELNELMLKLFPLSQHFNRYLTVGGFPELTLSHDDSRAQRLLREDVVDKVIKRDILSLFNVRNPLQLEKVFLYLCLHSSNIINLTTMSKELDSLNLATISSYIEFLKRSNLIYISNPIGLDGKAILKGKPKIYVADAAIRNAVLMIEDPLTEPADTGLMVETAVFKHLASFYYTTNAHVGYYRKSKDNQKEIDIVVDLPLGRILCEVKYRENSTLDKSDAIVEFSNDPKAKTLGCLVITKRIEDFGVSHIKTQIPIIRLPAAAFLYLLGHAEKEGYAARL